MVQLDKSIIICGKIRAGKSYLAKKIATAFDLPIASFGGFLEEYASGQGIDTSRNSLQDIGNGLIQIDPKKFLQDVILFSSANAKTIIFEGVRHQAIFNQIVAYSNLTRSVYLDIAEDIRLERYLASKKTIDNNASREEFFVRSAHPVESEIDSLKRLCNYVVHDDKV